MKHEGHQWLKAPFRTLARLDPALWELADLAPGTYADREAPDQPWVRVGCVYDDPLWKRGLGRERATVRKVFVVLGHDGSMTHVHAILRSRRAATSMSSA